MMLKPLNGWLLIRNLVQNVKQQLKKTKDVIAWPVKVVSINSVGFVAKIGLNTIVLPAGGIHAISMTIWENRINSSVKSRKIKSRVEMIYRDISFTMRDIRIIQNRKIYVLSKNLQWKMT